MSTNELESKVNELRGLRRMADGLAGEISAAEDALKAYMTANARPQLQDHMARGHQQPSGQQGP